MNLLYTPLIGFPFAVICYALGLAACATIIGLPIGLALFSLANRVLTLRR